ncbi:UNVERIFIED_CONTAM: hypothetical protein Slati_0152600 [Sesamum latifolium]|uniref:CCHC-type domain-containing protein n=1 Tax=Sesamum latifolium TaxID=2727402 RepID=A0AAW2YAF0_9LAMI
MMISLVEKLKDLHVDLEREDTYINVILQSLSPLFDQFIINYNMNRLDKSLHELTNMFVQYEVMIKKIAPSVLVGEASTSKVKCMGVRHWMWKKDETSSTAAGTSSAPVTPPNRGKQTRKRVRQPSISNDICIYCRENGHWKRECPKLLFDEGGGEE